MIIIVIDKKKFENMKYPQDKYVKFLMHSHSLAFGLLFNGNISS